MAQDETSSGAVRRPGRIRAPQDLAAGLSLLAISLFTLWAGRDLGGMQLGTPGPGMMPRGVAVAVGLAGIALLAASVVRRGEPLSRWKLRGPLFVTLGVVGFALTVRVPGLAVAGPIVVLVGGAASPETRLREIVVFAAIVTAFCIVLFRYLLHLPIPILVVPGVVVL